MKLENRQIVSNTAWVIHKKGRVSLQSCSCASEIAKVHELLFIPAVAEAFGYLIEFHRTLSYKGSCCTAWIQYILLNVQLLRQLSAALTEWCRSAVFSYLWKAPVAGTNWTGCRQVHVPAGGLHWPSWNDCSQKKSQIRFFLLWWSFPSCLCHNKTE